MDNDGNLSFDFREQLSFELSSLQNSIIDNVSFYSENLNSYITAMKTGINGNTAYLSENDLLLLHQNAKGAIVKKV